MKLGDLVAKVIMVAVCLGFIGFWLYCIFSGNVVGKVG